MRSAARRALPVAIAAALLLPPPAALASAQTKPEGRGILILTTGYYVAEDNFQTQSFGTATTPFGSGGKFDKVAESAWFEYGWTDNLNLLAGWEIAHLNFRNDSGRQDTNTGFGNPKFGLKYRFWNPPDETASMYAVQFEVEPPLGQSGTPSLGYQDPEVEVTLLASRKSELFTVPFGVSGQLGYRLRFGAAADEWRASYSLSKSTSTWYYWAGLNGEFSVGNEGTVFTSTNPQQGSDFDRVQVSSFVAHQLSRTYWLQLGWSYDVAGRNTGQGKEVKLGIWYTF